MVQPGSHCRRVGAASGAATPGGQSPPVRMAHARPSALPPSFLGSLVSPPLESLGRSPASWTLESITDPLRRSCQARAPGAVPSSSFPTHLSGTRARSCASPWDQTSLQLWHMVCLAPLARGPHGGGAGEPRLVAGPCLFIRVRVALALASPRESQGRHLQRGPTAGSQLRNGGVLLMVAIATLV